MMKSTLFTDHNQIRAKAAPSAGAGVGTWETRANAADALSFHRKVAGRRRNSLGRWGPEMWQPEALIWERRMALGITGKSLASKRLLGLHTNQVCH
jgi:hypothetical protein